MNKPLPLIHRLVVMLENFNKQPRTISMRGAATERHADSVKPRGAAAAALVTGGANSNASAHALARSRQPIQKNARTWRQGAAQTPSNLM
jgi:hypothetical protein